MKRASRLHRGILGVLVFTASLVAGEAVAEPAAAATQSQVMRVIVTGELMREEPASTALPSRGDPLPEFDSTGTRRRPGEPRFFTGSHVRQRIERYGNATSAAYNLQIFDRNDLGTSRRFGGPFGPSAGDLQARIAQERYVLDLRRVAPARRLKVATQLLGPARGQQLVAEFNRWQATH